MGRLLSVLAAAAVLGAVLLLPRADEAHLLALDAHELLYERIGPEPAAGAEDARLALWQVVLIGPASRELPDGSLELSLYGVRLQSTARSDDMTLHLELRRSLLRGLRQAADEADVVLRILGETTPAPTGASFLLRHQGGRRTLEYGVTQGERVLDGAVVSDEWAPPDRTAVLPPLVAVALAILFRRPLLALFAGILAGTFLVERAAGEGVLASLFLGLRDVVSPYFLEQLLDPERAMIIGFVVCMLAMVGVMTLAGGIRGLMDLVARRAGGARSTQLSAYLMGLLIFFDDYANTILVGSTMRPLTDRARVSREKLSFIVDSTAAPVAGLSIFSTWIAFEVSTFSAQLPAAGLATTQGYEIFLKTIPFSFYCLLMLFFVPLVALSGRDFGPMLAAERRARATGAVLRPGARPMVAEEATTIAPAEGVVPRAWRAVLPLVAFVGVTLFEIFRAGGAFAPGADLGSVEAITRVLESGSGSLPLLKGSIAGLLVAVLGALSAGQSGSILMAGWRTLRSMGVAFGILYFAWMIGAVCATLGTAPYLTALLGDSLDAHVLPTLLLLLAGFVAFATGSSWSTMSILLPLVVGLSYQLGVGLDLGPTAQASGRILMVMSIAAVLSGAIFGDHCSPISDTTVMSSIASAADHIDHVRTQMPYAVLVMAVAIACGYLPATYFGTSPWLSLLAGAGALAALLFWLGRRADAAPS